MTNELAPKDDVLAALEAAFAGIAPPPTDAPENFCTWYVDIWNGVEEAKARVTAQYEAMIRGLESKQKSLQYFKGQEFRQRIAAMIEATGGKKKSINLLTGKTGYRTVKGTLQINDEEAAMAWAEQNCPEAVKVTKRLVKTPLMDYLKDTGELPDGCELTDDVEKFYPWIDGTPRLTEGDSDDNNL